MVAPGGTDKPKGAWHAAWRWHDQLIDSLQQLASKEAAEPTKRHVEKARADFLAYVRTHQI